MSRHEDMDYTSAWIDKAFLGDSSLKKRIFDAIAEVPKWQNLFEDIAKFHLTNTRPTPSHGAANVTLEPAAKKRKVTNDEMPVSTLNPDVQREVLLEVKDVSFSIPQRKKLDLEIVQLGGTYNCPGAIYRLALKNPSSNKIESQHFVDGFSGAFRLPVPEKAQKQYNYCLVPKNDAQDPYVWTVNDGPTKNYKVNSPELESLLAGTDDVLGKALDFVFESKGCKIIFPNEKEFASATSESHRKGEKAYHVKAFRGSKDGYLFFLQNGIFFGFKKPLAFFPFDDIKSISYTSVLQRTFNLNISYQRPANAGPHEIEFSMIDQADFPGIDAYIKRHQLQDSSMADARKAKKIGIIAPRANQNHSAEEADDRTELQKAQQQIEEQEDEEDELEEDYNPGDDGDSDGSGSSSEEEEGTANEADGHDLVQEELGSEAESVEPDADDDNQL